MPLAVDTADDFGSSINLKRIFALLKMEYIVI